MLLPKMPARETVLWALRKPFYYGRFRPQKNPGLDAAGCYNSAMFKLFASLLIIGTLSGCASVQPWEKAELAQPQMNFTQMNPGRHFIDHALVTMEQAEGGNGKSGGGCGCR